MYPLYTCLRLNVLTQCYRLQSTPSKPVSCTATLKDECLSYYSCGFSLLHFIHKAKQLTNLIKAEEASSFPLRFFIVGIVMDWWSETSLQLVVDGWSLWCTTIIVLRRIKQRKSHWKAYVTTWLAAKKGVHVLTHGVLLWPSSFCSLFKNSYQW